MKVVGKLVGMTAGYFLGGAQWWAVLIGFMAGHWYDRIRSQNGAVQVPSGRRADWKRVKLLKTDSAEPFGTELIISYCHALFVLLGRIAKLDGRVSESSIQWVESLMADMGIRGSLREECIALFRQGKLMEGDLASIMGGLYWQIHPFAALKQQFVEVLVAAIYVDGRFNRSGWLLVLEVAAKLSYPEAKLWQLRHQYEDQISKKESKKEPKREPAPDVDQQSTTDWRSRSGRKSYRQSEEYKRAYHEYERQGGGSSPSKTSLDEALLELGISKQEWSALNAKDLKRIYRKLMSQYHPDKLIASGASQEELEQAKSKTQRVRVAYDMLKSLGAL